MGEMLYRTTQPSRWCPRGQRRAVGLRIKPTGCAHARINCVRAQAPPAGRAPRAPTAAAPRRGRYRRSASRTRFHPLGGQAGTHKYLKINSLFVVGYSDQRFRRPLALRLSCRMLNLCAIQPYISHEFDVHVITVLGLLTIFVSRTSKLRSQPAVAARSESWEQWLHGFGDRATGDAWTEGQSPRRQCVGARAKS